GHRHRPLTMWPVPPPCLPLPPAGQIRPEPRRRTGPWSNGTHPAVPESASDLPGPRPPSCNKPLARHSPLTTHHSYRLRPTLPRANANAILQRQNEDLPVADASFRPRAPRLHDGVDRRLDE